MAATSPGTVALGTASATDSPSHAVPLSAARLGRVLLWATAFGGLLLYAGAFRDTYIDDAYITLQYARNLAEHFTWGFLPDRTSNTATSPLNVLLLAGFDRLLPGATVDAVPWLTAAVWTLTLAVLLRLSRRLVGGPHFGLIAFVGLVTNPLLLSAIGLEGYLFALLLLACLLCFVEGRPLLLGVALGLLTLTRPDGLLLAVLLVALLPVGAAGRLKAGAACLLTAAPWVLFSWVHLGSAVPDTLIIKLKATAWGATTFADGLDLYRTRYPAATVASLWPVALAPFALLPWWRADRAGRRAVAALAAYAVAHYAVYAAMAVPPFHWYYTHQVVPIVVIGALGASALLRPLAVAPARPDRWAALAATALPAVGLAALAWIDGWPLTAAPITSNWATPALYRALGQDLRGLVTQEDVIDLHGEIGTVAYACECTVVDAFADPNRTSDMVDDLRARHSGLTGALLDANFAWRERADPLPLPTRLLMFDPIDAGETPPPPGQEVVATWDVSSPWIRRTQITLRATAHLSVAIRVQGPDGQPLPPEASPRLTWRLPAAPGGGCPTAPGAGKRAVGEQPDRGRSGRALFDGAGADRPPRLRTGGTDGAHQRGPRRGRRSLDPASAAVSVAGERPAACAAGRKEQRRGRGRGPSTRGDDENGAAAGVWTRERARAGR